MKFFKLFLPLLITLTLFAEDTETNSNDGILVSKNLYISYDEIPTEIYKNQQFEITLKAIITTPLWDRIETKFDTEDERFKIYDKSPGWKWVDDNTYVNKYFLKANVKTETLPKITVSIFNEDYELLEEADSPEKSIVYKDILGDKKYANVIATDLKVVSQNTKQYNNMTLMSVIELEGTKSNLEDFYLKEYEQQGTQSFEDFTENQKLIYYIMIPVYKDKIEFTYYNFETKRFVPVEIPIELEQDLISTQTDLNPSTSNVLIYKQIGLLVGVLILLVIYYFKRLKIILIAIVIALIIFGFTSVPNQIGTLKAGSNIYILPTKNSTLFQTTSRLLRVEVLNVKEGYIKILLPNQTIGWVKKNDIIKD